MKKYIKKSVLIVSIIMLFLLSGCAINSSGSGKGGKFEEKGGVVYVDGKELTFDKLLAMVGEATAQYRYSAFSDGGTTSFDYQTKRILNYDGRKLFVHAFDKLSNIYYVVTSGRVAFNDNDSVLYTSILDYQLRDDLKYYKPTLTIKIDDTTIPDTVCYKLSVTSTIDNQLVYQDFYVDTNTNLYIGWNSYSSNTNKEYVVKEIKYSDEPFIKSEYLLPEKDYRNSYDWYTGE